MEQIHFSDSRLQTYLSLARLDKPVGIFLLLWPTLWALWVAVGGMPSFRILSIFAAGVVCMRTAGCVINDWADRHWDGRVARTKNRPLATGTVSSKNAVVLFGSLCLCAFVLVCLTNLKTILFSIAALCVAVLYPFTKRFTRWPQAFLGVAFAFPIPMAFTAQSVPININTLLLFFATLAFTMAYDTQYAMVDYADDKKVGIKSTAVLFGRYARFMIGSFQSIALGLLVFLGIRMGFGAGYWAGLLGAFLLFVYQHGLMQKQNTADYFKAFFNNQWVGASIFTGIVLGLCKQVI